MILRLSPYCTAYSKNSEIVRLSIRTKNENEKMEREFIYIKYTFRSAPFFIALPPLHSNE